MIRWKFSKNKIRICAFILGNIIGFIMFKYLWTDSYFVNKYCNNLLIDRKFVQIKLDCMIFFVIYYEIKKNIFLNFIGITKYRRYFIDAYIVYIGFVFATQICALLNLFEFSMITSMFIFVIEKCFHLFYLILIEKYMIKYEHQIKTNIKYKCTIAGILFFINIGLVGIFSFLTALIFKFFIF